jgi:hypothetical protein
MQVRATLTLLRFTGASEREYVSLTVEAELRVSENGTWSWVGYGIHPNEHGITWEGLSEREKKAAQRNLEEAFMCLDDRTVEAAYNQDARKARRRGDLKAPRPWWVQQQQDGSFCVYAPSRFRGGTPILVAGYLCEEDARQIAWASTEEQVSPAEQNAATPAAEEAHS